MVGRLFDGGTCVIVFLATVIAMQHLEKLNEKRNETTIEACIEYYDENGHRVKDCEIKELEY